MALITKTYSPISGGYGRVYTSSQASFAASRGNTVGSATDSIGYISTRPSANGHEIARFFAPFDTSNIPDSSTVVSAFLRLIASGATFANGDTTTIYVVASTQASASALVAEDYDQAGTTQFGSLAFSAWTNTSLANNDITITDLTKISKTGNSMLALRTGRDYDNSAPTADNQLSWTSSTMILSVTYRVTDGLLGGEL